MAQVLSSESEKFPSPSDTAHQGDVSWPSCGMGFQKLLNGPNYFRNALFFFQDVSGELFWRQVGDVFLCARILAVEIAAVVQQFGGRHAPSGFAFFTLVPQVHDIAEC